MSMLQRRTDLPTIEILGINFSATTQAQLVATVDQRLRDGQGTFVVTANPEIVMYARAHPDYAKLLATQPDEITADGVGILLGGKILHTPLPERVTGYDLMLALLQQANQAHRRVYLIGAKAAVVAAAAARVRRDYPNLELVGTHDGYFDLSDAKVAQAVIDARPDYVFAALGFPKQEYFLSAIRPKLFHAFLMGVGGSFDVLAGVVARAPGWVQRLRLEWLYRLIKQPSRFGRMLQLPKFVLAVRREARQRGKID